MESSTAAMAEVASTPPLKHTRGPVGGELHGEPPAGSMAMEKKVENGWGASASQRGPGRMQGAVGAPGRISGGVRSESAKGAAPAPAATAAGEPSVPGAVLRDGGQPLVEG